MKRGNRRVVLSMLLALILAVVVFMPASADKPVHERFDWGRGGVDFIDTDACGVPLQAHLAGVTNHIVWFDQNGIPRGDQWSGVNRGTLTNEGRIVRLVSGGASKTTYLGESDGVAVIEVAGRGNTWKATVPGHGIVSGTVGNFTFRATCHLVGEGEWDCTIDEILKWSGLEFPDNTEMCNYLLFGE